LNSVAERARKPQGIVADNASKWILFAVPDPVRCSAALSPSGVIRPEPNQRQPQFGKDDDCIRHDLNPLYASATCILFVRCLYQSDEPVAQKSCLLLKIPTGIFKQNALQKRTATVDYERCRSYLVGQFRRTTCEV